MDDKERRALARASATARPISAYAAGALDASARARGFATTTLLSEWPAIVGAELAKFTMPDRVPSLIERPPWFSGGAQFINQGTIVS